MIEDVHIKKIGNKMLLLGMLEPKTTAIPSLTKTDMPPANTLCDFDLILLITKCMCHQNTLSTDSASPLHT